jgi:hypothetical protein
MRYHFILTSAMLLTTNAFQVTFYTGSGCRSGSPVTLMQRPEQGCQTNYAGSSKSQILKGDGSDKSFYMVYFSTDDCDPDHIIKKEDLGDNYSNKCVDTSGGYKSFQVWNVCEKPNCLE